MNEMTTVTTAKDWASDQEVRWCPGCGDYAVLKAVQRTMPDLGVAREKTVSQGCDCKLGICDANDYLCKSMYFLCQPNRSIEASRTRGIRATPVRPMVPVWRGGIFCKPDFNRST